MIDKNLRAVNNDGSFFQYRIEKSKNNKDILVINEKFIHSKFSPENEGNLFVFKGKNLIVIFGIGLGYHIINIIKNNPDSIFIIYEPIEEIFELSKRYIDNNILDNKNIIITNSINENEIFQFIENNYSTTDLRLQTYSNLGYKNLLPEIELSFFKTIKKTYEIVVQNILTESSFIPLWTKNLLNNFTNLNKKPFLYLKKQDLMNNLAVIICAGPGLNNELNSIKKNRNKITIFAVDTAIKTLNKNGIIPDFVISLDGQFYSFNDFIKNNDDKTAFIFDAVSYSKAVNMSKNIYFSITQNIFKNSIIEYFFKYFNMSEFGLSTGGTVADYTLNFCISLGFKNVYLTGLDLSFPDLLTHAKNSPYHERVLNKSTYFETPEGLMIKAISLRKVKSAESKIENKRILTDFVLENYAFYFEKLQESNTDINIYNSNQFGLKINGLKITSLDKLLENLDSKQIFSKDIISNLDKILIPTDKLKSFYENTTTKLYDATIKISQLLENKNNENKILINNWEIYLVSLYTDFPFLKKFLIMSEIVLKRQNIVENNLLYFKQNGYNILQSIYYIIRILQKSIKFIQN